MKWRSHGSPSPFLAQRERREAARRTYIKNIRRDKRHEDEVSKRRKSECLLARRKHSEAVRRTYRTVLSCAMRQEDKDEVAEPRESESFFSAAGTQRSCAADFILLHLYLAFRPVINYNEKVIKLT